MANQFLNGERVETLVLRFERDEIVVGKRLETVGPLRRIGACRPSNDGDVQTLLFRVRRRLPNPCRPESPSMRSQKADAIEGSCGRIVRQGTSCGNVPRVFLTPATTG